MKNIDSMISIERNLVQRCISNDRHAQRELFERYKNNMFTTCVRMVNDRDVASDVLQEAFIEVFKNLNSFQHKSTLGAWIKTIVIRKSIRSYKQKNIFEPLDETYHDTAFEWPEELTGQALDQAIKVLPTGCKSIFLLIEVEGYKHKEVAEMMGISEGTSKSQLHHAKILLRKILKDYRYGN